MSSVIVAGLVLLTACSGGASEEPAASSSSTAVTVAPDDPTLEPLLITTADLPAGFAENEDVSDTITAFCAGQDAAAGLQASGRAIAGYTRTPSGASVIEIVFRFDADGAARFVGQAEQLFGGCNEVPDVSGLAFTYEMASPAVAASLEGVEAAASRYGVSVGSGTLTVNAAVVQQGDLGALVAVLGIDQPRGDLDELAVVAFAAALDRLTA